MARKYKVLWIEDGANAELKPQRGPIIASMRIELDPALNASEGFRKILRKEYDAVVVDIRLPHGRDKVWRDLYRRRGNDKTEAKLGLIVLRSLFAVDRKVTKDIVPVDVIPKWVEKRKFAALTVETELEIKRQLDELGIRYQHKSVDINPEALLHLIEKILDEPGCAKRE